MSYTLVETLKQMGAKIKQNYISKTSKIDYNTLKNQPITFNFDSNENIINHTYSQLTLTDQTWDPINNEYYKGSDTSKYVEGNRISENDPRTNLEIPCEIGDDIFVLMSYYESFRGLGTIGQGWEKIYEGNVYSTDTYDYYTYYKVYHKKAASSPEYFTADNSSYHSSYTVQALAISGANGYEITPYLKNQIKDYVKLNQDGDASLILFAHPKGIKRDITFADGIEAQIYHSSTNRAFMLFTTEQERLYKASNSLWGFDGESATYVTRYPDIIVITLNGVNSMEAIEGEAISYTLVEPSNSFDSTAKYYKRSVTTYDGSEVANKDYVDSLDLSDVSSTEGTYVYVRKCTVTVDSSGNKTPVYSWELDNRGGGSNVNQNLFGRSSISNESGSSSVNDNLTDYITSEEVEE